MAAVRPFDEERNAACEPLVIRGLLDNGVLLVTSNRPERSNAWDEAMEVQYHAVLDEAVDDEQVR